MGSEIDLTLYNWCQLKELHDLAKYKVDEYQKRKKDCWEIFKFDRSYISHRRESTKYLRNENEKFHGYINAQLNMVFQLVNFVYLERKNLSLLILISLQFKCQDISVMIFIQYLPQVQAELGFFVITRDE